MDLGIDNDFLERPGIWPVKAKRKCPLNTEMPSRVLVQIDDFGELMPPDQDTLLSSEDRIPGGRHGGIFEVQAVQAKLPLANTVHQLNARNGGGRVPEAFEAEHRVCSGLYVAMVLLDQVIEIF